VGHDVTDRRQAAEALRESQARFSAIFNHAPFLVFIKDAEGRHLMVNRMFERFLDRSAEKILGKTDEDLFGPEIGRNFRAGDRHVLESHEVMQIESSFALGDKSYTFLTTKFTLPASGSGNSEICGLALDISLRKRAEEALRQSEEKYRILADGMPLFIAVLNPAGQLEFCNARWHELTTLSMEETSRGGGLQLIHPEDRPLVLHKSSQGFRSGAPFSTEFRLRGASEPVVSL
jgi:PAS domain S-box-containing protein